MGDPHYLFLTKRSLAKDATEWGIPIGNAGLTVTSHGDVDVISEWEELPDKPRRVLVLNMADSDLEARLEQYAHRIASIAGKTPRIWVHFGNINSATMRVEDLCEHWSRKEYDPFRGFTKHPIPYSQAWPADFDQYVKELSKKIKDQLDDGDRKTARLADMDAVLAGLDQAWQMATAKFPEKDIERELDANRDLRAAQDLMPVFIYFDGLLYASEKAEDKLEEMAKVVREGVPEVLEAISVEATSGRAQEISSRRDDLSGVGTVDLAELVVKGREFCHWYRDLFSDVMPESAATGETIKETRP